MRRHSQADELGVILLQERVLVAQVLLERAVQCDQRPRLDSKLEVGRPVWLRAPVFQAPEDNTKRVLINTSVFRRNFRFRCRFSASLPSIMGKSLIRFRHSMSVFLFFDRRTRPVEGVEQFGAQARRHR